MKGALLCQNSVSKNDAANNKPFQEGGCPTMFCTPPDQPSPKNCTYPKCGGCDLWPHSEG